MSASAGPSTRRILHIATRFLQGGAERNILNVMRWEREAGFDVELLVGRDSSRAMVPPEFALQTARSLVREVDPVRDLLALREIQSAVVHGSYDIVHTHLSKAGVIGRIAARRRVRRVAHTVHMASFGPGYGPVGSLIFREAERRCAPIADILAFVGNELRDHYLAAGVGTPSQSIVIRSPVDVDRFAETRTWTPSRRAEARRQLGISNDGPLIVSIGMLSPRKRHALMLERLAPLITHLGAQVAIAGEGNPEPLRLVAIRLGIVERLTLLGHLPEAVDLLAAADVLVHTADVEGVPQVVIQALAAGKPVVASDVMGLREVEGAKVTIVPSSAEGLGPAVAAQLESPGAPTNIAFLAPWTRAAVEDQIATFHSRLA